ncbi:DNA polymerase IV [Occultella gossypii]|uniref:DNA polymerase IV n=1 Tax=Occultella gossypii TaxID=2800820 RepID=A0ABS7S3F9_9MICO|nr:DNA polymerase IV [Occultella gossypii]MBZ2194881.1 DNA polymerase IV [Occultella gossypii]
MSAEPGPSTPGTTVHRVLHVDLDQFIAAVEVLRRPELAGKPVIVGGRGDPTERAVVSTASYEAREFGARSGMPLRVAARKVPDAVILPVDHNAYNEASEQVMASLRGLGVVVEVLGWDEAFLGAPAGDPGMFADAEAFAARVRAAVLAATDLHCSVGVGDNKVRAKIATDFGKPRGTFVLTAENWFEVMGDRDTIALWGVGSKVSKRLLGHGIRTVRELADADEDLLVGEFGPRMGRWYHDLGRGEGPAEVDDSPWIARGHSRETTYQRNLTTPAEVAEAVAVLAEQAFEDTDAEGRAVMRVTLKVRYAPFFTFTRARKLPAPTRDRAEVVAAALGLAADLDPEREVRLLGVRAEMVMPDGGDPAERTPVRGRL